MSGRADPKKLARAIETELRRTGSPERAAGEKRYLKSDMDFLGATLADIRWVARPAARDPALDRDGAVRLVEELWSVPTFDAVWPRRSSWSSTLAICDQRTSR